MPPHSYKAPGPSPRARGSHGVNVMGLVPQGSIPASAGEPGRRPCRPPRPGVHPRERGGASALLHRQLAPLGPSPRARGSPIGGLPDHFALRSIPASAGEPAYGSTPGTPARVHPRERGGAPGSPPGFALAERSIPASAGEPKSEARSSRSSTVHPRERGGASGLLLVSHSQGGPSPRARGSQAGRSVAGACAGSIPASAGEPHARR